MNSNAHEYKVNATKVALHLLREPDIFETNMKLFCAKDLEEAFIAGAQWQQQQSTWVSVKDRLPDYNENIIIMCKHGAIFNGTYCNGVWFCMDGYIHDTFKGTPVYSSMASIPPLWEPIAWITIPKFNDSGCSEIPNNWK